MNGRIDTTPPVGAGPPGDALDNVVTHCRVVAFSCDQNGRCVFINKGAEQVLGRPVGELLGATLTDILPSLPSGDTRLPAEHEFSVTIGDETRDYLVVLTPQIISEGSTAAVHGMGVDVSSLTRRLREGHASNERKERFLGIVAHEMRNPLSTVRAGLKVLERSPSHEQAKEAHQLMDRQIGYLSRLVGDLLDVTRINQGRMHVSKAPFLLSELVRLALETTGCSLNQGQHAVKVSVPDGAITVCGDLERLSQVLCNLLDNAAKYTPAAGEISLNVIQDGADLVFTVSDNGIGISADQIPRIFEVFSQLDDGADKRRGGLGIGLFLVKKIVEAHGGTIGALSDGAGRGSSFCVRIPCGGQQ